MPHLIDKNYFEHIRPLTTSISEALDSATEQLPEHFSEFDLYQALGATMYTMLVGGIPDEIKEHVLHQAREIADLGYNTVMRETSERQYYILSTLIAVTRLLMSTVATSALEIEQFDQDNPVIPDDVEPATPEPTTP